MLFCPPLPPIRLGVRFPVFIGRHPSCELSLRSDDVSRRHAEVRCEQEGYVLHDLRSTNGTFLNGAPIDSAQALSAGDRILIGGRTITFCEIAPQEGTSWGDTDEAATVICHQPSPSQAHFSGDLAQIPIPALFQLLEMGSNTGLIAISSDDGEAQVHFEMGRPVHAATEKHVGFDALLEIAAIERGHFAFGPSDVEFDATIQASVTEVLLEACRLADEANVREANI
jgi:pSer/pThr/pTyr-binding forkhead associated (FHA) protein